MTTPRRFSGSGPKNDTNAPCIPAATSEGCCESVVRACMKPPLLLRTVAITATIPKSITIPWIKSFATVAI